MIASRLLGAVVLLSGLAAPLHALSPAPIPLAPAGRVSGGPRPEFRWTDTGAARYSFRWTADVGGVLSDEVTDNRYQPASDLMPGGYTWQVRHGPLADANQNPWSAPVAFVIPPATPVPNYPSGWQNRAAFTNPVFNFIIPYNSAIHRFTVQLYDEIDGLLGAFHVSNAPPKDGNLVWPGTLPTGAYHWRVRATRLGSGGTATIHSDWSLPRPFTVGIPARPAITNPPPGLVLVPGVQHNRFYWTPQAGASGYRVEMLHNDLFELSMYNFSAAQVDLYHGYNPGYYTVTVAATNKYGTGPWSAPYTFLVRRLMFPGENGVLVAPPAYLSFSRSQPASSYEVKLFRYSPSAAAYELIHSTTLPQTGGGGLVWNTPTNWFSKGSYKWTVSDFNNGKKLYTSSDYFSMHVPGRPFQLEPKGAIYGRTALTFVWERAPGSDAHQFQLWMKGSKIADSGWLDYIKGDGLSATLNLPTSAVGALSWRVRAKNVYGPGAWVGAKVNVQSLPAPVFTLPTNGVTFASGTWIETRWKPVKNATRYQVQILKNGGLDDNAEFPASEGCFYHFLAAPGSYAIKVRAGDVGFGPWSKRTFSVSPP